MINISFIGLDLYLVGEMSEKFHDLVSKAFGVPSEDLVFSSYDSFVYHQGHEQTSFNLLIKVECDAKFKENEAKIAETLLKISENYSVHATVYFTYIEEKSVYSRVNPSYPRFLEGGDDEEEEDNYTYDENEVYTGNMFEEFDKEHPEDQLGSFEEDIDENNSYNIFKNYKK